MYDFVTLPADMRFKFAYDLSKWMEYFDWQCLPHDWSNSRRSNADENKNLQNLIEKNRNSPVKQDTAAARDKMRAEIDGLLGQTGQ